LVTTSGSRRDKAHTSMIAKVFAISTY